VVEAAADPSGVRLGKLVLDNLRVGYLPEILNGLFAAMVGVETDAIAIGILHREIMMAI